MPLIKEWYLERLNISGGMHLKDFLMPKIQEYYLFTTYLPVNLTAHSGTALF